MVTELNDTNFVETIKNGFTLVDFWATWCGPCKMLGPVIEELSKDLENKVKVCKFDVDQGKEIPAQFGIMGVPALLIFKDGVLIAQRSGMAPKKVIQDWINSNI
jgi:thioredoxin 1